MFDTGGVSMVVKHKTIIRFRDADKGHFVTEEYAKKHPKTTIKDNMKIHPEPKKPPKK